MTSSADRPSAPDQAPPAPSSPAERALAEAHARRAAAAARTSPPLSKEIDGPAGLDPARYGDWERKGIASDF